MLVAIVFFDSNTNQFGKNQYSEKTNELIDIESMKLLFNAYEEAKTVIRNNKDAIDELTKILLRENVISGDLVISKIQ